MSEFWKEWFRVLSREMMLVGLLVYFHFTHASDILQGSLIAGVLTQMNATRFQYPKKD